MLQINNKARNHTYSQNSVAGVVAFAEAVQLDDTFLLSNSTQNSVAETGKKNKQRHNRYYKWSKCKDIFIYTKRQKVVHLDFYMYDSHII